MSENVRLIFTTPDANQVSVDSDEVLKMRQVGNQTVILTEDAELLVVRESPRRIQENIQEAKESGSETSTTGQDTGTEEGSPPESD